MSSRLLGKVAIVTGGSMGIGRAIARKFADEGALVVLCARRKDRLREAWAQITATGARAMQIQCDVSDAVQVKHLVAQTMKAFGRLDVLVNNAGVRGRITTAETLTQEEWQQTFDVDAKGTWLCAKYAVPQMRKSNGGSIIMITSISSLVGQPMQGCYNAAKAAQELLGKCMALDFAKDHIRVNAICPGWIRSEMNRAQLAEMEAEPDKLFPPGLTYRQLLQMHPIGYLGDPEDVAWAAVYLASDESRWVTGSSLMVDGGYTCQ